MARIGVNPEGQVIRPLTHAHHRVIVPVYIPTLEGFFANAFEVLKLSLESLFATTTEQTRITIVDNASCQEVKDLLKMFLQEGLINKLVVNQENRGKVEVVLSEARASTEEFITIADADTFFRKGWLQATFLVFKTFPKTGVVSPIPQPHLFLYQNYSCFLETFLTMRLKVGNVLEHDEVERFYRSIDFIDKRPIQYATNLRAQYYLKKSGIVAILGASHQVATYRREIFNAPLRKVSGVFGRGIEKAYLDVLSLKRGYWRLSTGAYYADHIGNSIDHEYPVEVFKEAYGIEHIMNGILCSLKIRGSVWVKYLAIFCFQVSKRLF